MLASGLSRQTCSVGSHTWFCKAYVRLQAVSLLLENLSGRMQRRTYNDFEHVSVTCEATSSLGLGLKICGEEHESTECVSVTSLDLHSFPWIFKQKRGCLQFRLSSFARQLCETVQFALSAICACRVLLLPYLPGV